ncbi:hypothetical protein GCM10027341_56610 [Spirosoma knui]
MASCQTISPVEPDESVKGLTRPAFIDYHADGTLAHLVYRAQFTYNAINQLESVRDSLLAPSAVNRPIVPWVKFSYLNHRLIGVSLRSLSNDLDSTAYSWDKPARFDLTYEGPTLSARLVIDDQEVKKASFGLDQEGYPLKSNVKLGRLYLNNQGHFDLEAESKDSKSRNPNVFYEVLDQQYDHYQTVFAQSKEYQILAALLASFNRSVGSSTGLTGLDVLTSNNLLSRTKKYCTALYGCQTSTLKSETLQVNKAGFPLQRVAPVGVMGQFTYTITYQ